jgi:hypothetical protein
MLSTSAPRISTWKQVQAAKEAYSKTTFRQPSFWLHKDDPKHRAIVTVYFTLTDNQIHSDAINVVLTHHRTERRYSHITLASLHRLSRIAPLPLLSDAQFEALDNAAVAAAMLKAGQEQADRKPELKTRKGYQLIDRVDAAIAYGQVEEMVNEEPMFDRMDTADWRE